MEDSSGIEERSDVAVGERILRAGWPEQELRSVGMHEEAEQIQLVLRRSATLLAGPWDTE
jgi:hypothetical protein